MSLYGLGVLLVAVVAAVGLVLPVWAAALIVGAAVLVLAGGLGVVGMAKVKQAAPPIPEQAIASANRDVETVKESVKR
jgi:hypothetical protein